MRHKMRIKAGFAGAPAGSWTVDLGTKVLTVEDLWNYINTHRWLPILVEGKSGQMEPGKALNLALLTTISIRD